jgi:acyl-CoA thioester hydrolase
MKRPHKLLTGFPVVTPVSIIWGDEDAFGHVNNVMYLRWCETARVEYLKSAGLWPAQFPPSGFGPILASITCDYRRPVTYPDTVYVGARVTSIGNSSLRMEHRVVSKALDVVVAEASSTIVMLDYATMKSVPVPDECRKSVAGIEGGRFVADAKTRT